MFHPRQENCNRPAEIRYFRIGLIGKAKSDYLAARTPIGSGFRDKFHREVPVYGTKARTVLTPNPSLECDESRPYSKGSTWKILQRCERIVSP